MDQRRTVLSYGRPDVCGLGVLPPGRMIAGYRIEGRAGAGGMGIVYRAVDVELGRLVALKVIAPALAQDERFRERFRSESRKVTASSLAGASIPSQGPAIEERALARCGSGAVGDVWGCQPSSNLGSIGRRGGNESGNAQPALGSVS